MYLEICESLGLYGMAARSYDRKLRREHIYQSVNENRKCCLNWIQRYENEENWGIVNLQRQRRLKEEGEGVIAIPLKENRDRLKDDPPNYEATIHDQQNQQIPDQQSHQLEELREQYWSHLQELLKLETEKPKGLIIAKWELLRRYKIRHGVALTWVRDSQACARHGGCCGRDCGCCDRPLEPFLMPINSSKKTNSGVYGHCTVECPCCIRFRGFYKPNSAKPAPAHTSDSPCL